MFKRVGLDTNLEKIKSLVCTPGYIWGKWSKEVYKRRATGDGETFRERKWSRVSCAEYGLTVSYSSLKWNMERQHGIIVPQTREVEIGGEVTIHLCIWSHGSHPQ